MTEETTPLGSDPPKQETPDIPPLIQEALGSAPPIPEAPGPEERHGRRRRRKRRRGRANGATASGERRPPCDDWIDRIVDACQREQVEEVLAEHDRLLAALVGESTHDRFRPFAPPRPFPWHLPAVPEMPLDPDYGGLPACEDD